MLRTELQDTAAVLTVKLQGRLSGHDAEYLGLLLVRSYQPPKDLVVDMTDVMSIDWRGESTLALLGRLGAKFVAVDPYVFNVCERLELPVTKPGTKEKPKAARDV